MPDPKKVSGPSGQPKHVDTHYTCPDCDGITPIRAGQCIYCEIQPKGTK